MSLSGRVKIGLNRWVERLGSVLGIDRGGGHAWLNRQGWADGSVYGLAIVVLGGLYGASMGLWRSPLQAAFGAVKFPLAILVTIAGTSLANFMLSKALGLNVSLRQSATLILASFAIAAVILASFVPVSLFFVLSVPPFGSDQEALAVSIITVVHVILVAVAGTSANAVLYRSLKSLAGPRSAGHILFAWLSMNLFLGAQVSWNMRPFIGSPVLDVEFIRQDAFAGSFYEDVFVKVLRIFRIEGQ